MAAVGNEQQRSTMDWNAPRCLCLLKGGQTLKVALHEASFCPRTKRNCGIESVGLQCRPLIRGRVHGSMHRSAC